MEKSSKLEHIGNSQRNSWRNLPKITFRGYPEQVAGRVSEAPREDIKKTLGGISG